MSPAVELTEADYAVLSVSTELNRLKSDDVLAVLVVISDMFLNARFPAEVANREALETLFKNLVQRHKERFSGAVK